MSAPATPRPPLVFVSYDFEDASLRHDVLGLANDLRRDGVDARIDLYEPSPAEGWELWRERLLLAADFVVVACTPSYRRHFEAHDGATGGLQVRWEAVFLRRRLHDDPSFGAQVLPVLLGNHGLAAVPERLRSYTSYALPGAYEALVRRITGQPAIVGPSLGALGHRIDNLGLRPLVFEGREDDLAATRDELRRAAKLGTCAVISGMGGVGKTRLALEHAHRSEADYDVRWWVRAGNLPSLQADLVALGVELGILAQPEHTEASAHEVLAWLSTHRRWLLVLDDVEDPTALHGHLPRPGRGHVLITSRSPAWRSIAQVVKLSRLSPPAARALLVRRSGRPDDGHADAVAEALDHLPLALTQAAAYVETTGCSFRDYLDHFAREGVALLDNPSSILDGDHETVARTWELSLTEIRRLSPAAAALLDWLAFLDPGGVPIQLLQAHASAMPVPLRACVESSRALDQAIAVLRRFGLVERDDGMLRVHHIIQAVTREKLATIEQQRVAVAVLRWIQAVFAYTPGETRVHDVPVGIAEQIMAVSTIGACRRADGERIAALLIDVGDFHLVRGASQAAHTAYARAVELHDARLKAQPRCEQARRDLSIALNRLGSCEAWAGNIPAAKHRFSCAFALRKELAYEDPLSPRAQDDLASSLSKLGDLALHDGDHGAAVAMYAQAVELRELLVETAPTDTVARRSLALSSRQLGHAKARLGDLHEAERTLQRALEIADALVRAFPGNRVARRDLLLVLIDIGDVLVRDGKAELAGEHQARALDLAEALAAEDPASAQAQRDLSIGLNRRGLAERRKGRVEAARHLLERALELRRALARANPQDEQAQYDLELAVADLEDQEDPTSEDPSMGWFDRCVDEDDREGPSRTPAPRARDARWPRETAKTGPGELTRPCFVVAPDDDAGGRHFEAVFHADQLAWLGRSALDSGNLETARQCFRLRASVNTVLAKVGPCVFEAQRSAAIALHELGQVEHRLGALDPARDRLRRCVEHFESLLATHPSHAPTRRDLATSLVELGAVERKRGDLERARELLTEAYQRFDAIATLAPQDVTVLEDLGLAVVELGITEQALGDLEAAREQFQRGLDLAYEIVDLEPSRRGTWPGILRALQRLASIEIDLGNRPEVDELFRVMLAEEEVLTEADPETAMAALDLVLRHA